MDKYPLLRKCLAVGIILLFIGMSIIPSTAQDSQKTFLSTSTEKNQRFDTTSIPLPPPERWVKIYGGIGEDTGYSIKQTTDGGYIIAGGKNGSAWMLKIDSNGDVIWESTYSGIGLCRHVQQTSDGGYIIIGEKSISDKEYIWLMKTDDTGNRIWNSSYSRADWDEGLVVQQTTDSGYFIVANAWSWSSSSEYVYYWLLKTDNTGHMMWEKTFGGTWYDVCYSGQQTIDGGYIITGCTTGDHYFEGWLIKTDGNGDMVWNKTFQGTNDVICKAVQQTSDGGYIIAADFCWEEPRILLIKTDSHGNITWEKVLDKDKDDYAKTIQQTTDGGYIIIGKRYINESSFYDFLLMKTDGEGNILWEQTFGNSKFDEAESGQQTTDGGYILSGNIANPGEWSDLWVIKTDEQGSVNNPPDTPDITGKNEGKINTYYNYNIHTTDPDQNKVQYFVNWGDNTTTLTGFNESGKEITVSHIWDTKGTYNIKVKAIDEYRAESDWATLSVIMPYSYNPMLQFLERLFQRFPNAFPLLRHLMGY